MLPTMRVAAAGDGNLLGAFSCSRGLWFEDEVDAFIQEHALEYAAWRAPLDHQLLLIFLDEELVGVGAHEQAPMSDGSLGTHLAVGALGLAHRGTALADGRRLSDFLLDALIIDASTAAERGQPPRTSRAHALVALENDSSLAFLRRRGFVDERVDSDERYVRLYAEIS